MALVLMWMSMFQLIRQKCTLNQLRTVSLNIWGHVLLGDMVNVRQHQPGRYSRETLLGSKERLDLVDRPGIRVVSLNDHPIRTRLDSLRLSVY